MKLPHTVSYTNSVEGGSNRFWTIKINPKFKDNKGLYIHEYQHVKQWYAGFGVGLAISAILYFLGYPNAALVSVAVGFLAKRILSTYVRKARQWLEVDAFRKQIAASPHEHRAFFIKVLVENYDLNITEEKAEELLYGKK